LTFNYSTTAGTFESLHTVSPAGFVKLVFDVLNKYHDNLNTLKVCLDGEFLEV